jgi:DNA-binding winged helix-turn-helix (wHTH) protein/tetratricopeptide (TPR) repeat protein
MPAYRFDRHELVPGSRRLIHDGHDLAVGLRVFDVIVYLVENRERAVGRDELIAAVWGRVDAGDALLAQAILKARRAFGDDGNAQHYIRTVPRFGYQWVAATEVAEPSARAPAPAPERDVSEEPASTPAIAPVARRQAWMGSPRWRTAAVAAAIGLASIGAGLFALRHHAAAPLQGTDSAAGPILVLPTTLEGTIAEDGWMRLGVMSLSAQALADIPGRAVVPDDTALAALAQAGSPPDPGRLRAQTGAAFVITSEASHAGEEWQLSATVSGADGSRQIVAAHASDAVVAAGALAKNLHDLFAPGAVREGEALPPDVLALEARMKAAILEGQNGRALALAGRAEVTTASAPAIVLLRAEALNQLGRFDESAVSLQALLEQAATDPAPHWLPAAWSALGDCELARGHPDQADAHFRRALALAGDGGDRRTAGLAWRGLGIAQAVRNDLDGAEASYLHARQQLEPIGDRLVLARIIDGLGYIAAQRGRLADALLAYDQAASMAAAFGANETELGSRLNGAQSRGYLLQHTRALEQIRALLPRLRRLDYPALHRFGLVAYAGALVETGDFAGARTQLAQLAAEAKSAGATDAVVDVRLDEARYRLATGDAAGAIALASSLRGSFGPQTPADLRLETAALLLAALGDRDATAAQALVADPALWEPAHALPPARVHALVARAGWQAAHGDAAAAEAGYAQASTLAREFGAPVILRDVIVPHASWLLATGQVPAADAAARVLTPYAEDDFDCALLLARVAAARRDGAQAQAWFARARGLAGERWGAPLDAEAAAAMSPDSLPPANHVAAIKR